MTNSVSEILNWSKQLTAEDVTTRREAARRLALSASAASVAATGLVNAVGDHDEEVANQAAEALENLGPPREQDLQELMQFLLHANADCGYWAATLIGRLGASGAGAVSSLASAVASHPATSVRERAAWALGQIGSAASAARETLEAASHSSSPRLARLAQESLTRIVR